MGPSEGSKRALGRQEEEDEEDKWVRIRASIFLKFLTPILCPQSGRLGSGKEGVNVFEHLDAQLFVPGAGRLGSGKNQ